MRSETATTGRVRLVIVLSVAAAVTVMIGAVLVAVGPVMHMVTKRQPAHLTRLGLDVIAAGIAFGVVVLVVFAIARIGGTGRRRPRKGRTDHRRGAARQDPAAALRGHGRSPGQGRDRLRDGTPPGGDHAPRDGAARSARRSVLNPTNVYSPGGLIDVPRDGHGPGTPGGEDIPEILRTAGPGPAPGGPAPGAQAGGWSQDRSSSGRAGPQPPRHGYPPGMNPGGPGRTPYGPGGQSVPPMPPRDHGRPREAPRPGYPMPGRDGMPPRGAGPQRPREASRPAHAAPPPGHAAPPPGHAAPPPGHAGPPRDSGLFRDPGPPRDGTGPGGPFRPGGPMPPRDSAYPPPPGAQGQGRAQDRGAGRHAGGPGYASPGGRRPGPPGHAGAPGHRGPGVGDESFDGGYAQVIRASDHPVRPAGPVRTPGFGRPAEPVRPPEAPADVFVYRDTSDQPGGPSATVPGPGENDAAYWYDLPVAGAGTDARAHVVEEARGPFEPLVSSADPPGAAPPAAPDAAHPDQAPDAAGPDGPREETVHDRARKLEQIKDLYLTAEAIGEANVDKHFDQLLAQQRELISEYFRQPGPAGPAAAGGPAAGADSLPAGAAGFADQAETEPGARRDPAPPPPGPAGPSEAARIAADQPRAW